jgi:hypothetical protein
MNQRNVKMQRIDRSRAPVNVPKQSYGTRVKEEIKELQKEEELFLLPFFPSIRIE